MRKYQTKLTICSLLTFYLSACGGAGTGNQPGSGPAGAAASEAHITAEVTALLESYCSQRPSRNTINTTRNGQDFIYTEALAEQDTGQQITSATKLLATNTVGTLVLKPSTDNNVSWGARQWALSPTQAEADTALTRITITSRVVSDEAKIQVDHPNSQTPGTRYNICMVVMAPAEWIAQLENNTGNIISENHAGPIYIDNGAGNVMVSQNGPGFITANTDSGTIHATGDSRGGANLTTQTGTINYRLNNGGVSLQQASRLQTGSGTIRLNLQDGFGINLEAATNTGSITVPSDFPSPTVRRVTGEHFEAQTNGGGALLNMVVDTGSVIIGNF